MKAKKLFFIFFGLIILIIPIYVMMMSEGILKNGHLHKIHLQGYDPFDPFRGKYLRLSYDDYVTCDFEAKEDQSVYVTLAKDSLGFSYFDKAFKDKPSHDDYFETIIISESFFWDTELENRFRIKLDNISKYFINEDKAAKAEEVVQTYTRDHPNDIYAAVRILDGEARLEDIYIQEIPLLEFLAK